MEALGDQMDDAFDGMDEDFEQMGKDISKQVRKALIYPVTNYSANERRRVGGIGAWLAIR
jgi:hypothetical protein